MDGVTPGISTLVPITEVMIYLKPVGSGKACGPPSLQVNFFLIILELYSAQGILCSKSRSSDFFYCLVIYFTSNIFQTFYFQRPKNFPVKVSSFLSFSISTAYITQFQWPIFILDTSSNNPEHPDTSSNNPEHPERDQEVFMFKNTLF